MENKAQGKKIERGCGLVLMLLVLMLLTPATGAAQSAPELNTAGFHLYKLQQYGEASEYFARAIEADPTHALAHYNLACTLAILRTKGGVCDYEAYRSRIIRLLNRSVELDPNRRERMKNDADLVSVHDTFGWQKLMGLSPGKSAELTKILVAVTWYGPAPGVYGNISGLDFSAGGKLDFWAMKVSDEGVQREFYTGRFSVEGLRIKIKLDKAYDGKREFEGTLESTGRLMIPDLPGPFNDEPEECGA